MKNIISLTGDIASGKGVTSEVIANKLNYNIYKVSSAIRELCKEKGIDINQFQDYVAKHPEFDRKVESSMKEYAEANDNFLIEARTGWFVAPFSFKVYLTVDTKIGAIRLCHSKRDDEAYKSPEEAEEMIKKRFEAEAKRWLYLYGYDIKDKNNFDLVVDTNNKTAEEVADIIIEAYNKKRKEEGLLK